MKIIKAETAREIARTKAMLVEMSDRILAAAEVGKASLMVQGVLSDYMKKQLTELGYELSYNALAGTTSIWWGNV